MAKDTQLTAEEVAEYFLWISHEEGKAMTNKKLQKLIYYAQAWSLALRNGKIFNDKIEAWVHGPAVRAVYVKYKKFGFGAIQEIPTEKEIAKIPEEAKNFLNEVWRVYGKYDAAYLERLSHSETPWQKARENLEPNIGSENEVSPTEMRLFYSAKLKNKAAA